MTSTAAYRRHVFTHEPGRRGRLQSSRTKPSAQTSDSALDGPDASRILILAHMPSISILLRLHLESKEDFLCEVTTDTNRALRRLDEQPFALLIVDEVSRAEDALVRLAQALKQLPPDRRPRTLLSTNRDHPSEHAFFLQAGYDCCLSKPFSKRALLDAVDALIDTSA